MRTCLPPVSQISMYMYINVAQGHFTGGSCRGHVLTAFILSIFPVAYADSSEWNMTMRFFSVFYAHSTVGKSPRHLGYEIGTPPKVDATSGQRKLTLDASSLRTKGR